METQSRGPVVTPALFAEWHAPRFGTANPTRLTNPVWEWLARSELSAYSARQHFGIESGECDGPGWSFARFGRSETMLADGRCVLIAGEHEDAYDQDFHIYNDVVVRQVDGSLEIFGYPREVFPPTDFHSATLVGDRIVIIGSLGYPADRVPGTTQVAILDLDALTMTSMPSSGEAPGWIHRHSASLVHERNAIVISGGLVEEGTPQQGMLRENGDDWRLDITTWRWERLTNRNWRQWDVRRTDRRPNQLWRMRSLARVRDVQWANDHRESMEAMIRRERDAVKEAYGVDPDLETFDKLYDPPIAHVALPATDEVESLRVSVEGIVVRYVEAPWSVRLVVEGKLPDAVTAALVADLREKLSIIEHTAYETREL